MTFNVETFLNVIHGTKDKVINLDDCVRSHTESSLRGVLRGLFIVLLLGKTGPCSCLHEAIFFLYCVLLSYYCVRWLLPRILITSLGKQGLVALLFLGL